MHEPLITVTGNVAAVPVLREHASGTRVAASGSPTPRAGRTRPPATGPTARRSGSASPAGAPSPRTRAQSLKPGDRVVVTGRLSARTWTAPTGEERSGLEIDADLGRPRPDPDARRGRAAAAAAGQRDPGERRRAASLAERAAPTSAEAPRGGRCRAGDAGLAAGAAAAPAAAPAPVGWGHGAVHLPDAEGPQGRRRQGHPRRRHAGLLPGRQDRRARAERRRQVDGAEDDGRARPAVQRRRPAEPRLQRRHPHAGAACSTRPRRSSRTCRTASRASAT